MSGVEVRVINFILLSEPNTAVIGRDIINLTPANLIFMFLFCSMCKPFWVELLWKCAIHTNKLTLPAIKSVFWLSRVIRVGFKPKCCRPHVCVCLITGICVSPHPLKQPLPSSLVTLTSQYMIRLGTQAMYTCVCPCWQDKLMIDWWCHQWRTEAIDLSVRLLTYRENVWNLQFCSCTDKIHCYIVLFALSSFNRSVVLLKADCLCMRLSGWDQPDFLFSWCFFSSLLLKRWVLFYSYHQECSKTSRPFPHLYLFDFEEFLIIYSNVGFSSQIRKFQNVFHVCKEMFDE